MPSGARQWAWTLGLTMPVAFEGGCFCGEIRYRAKSVFDSGYCHCSMCRRFTGCPALTWFSVPEHDFSLVSGVPKAFQSSATFTRYFCSTCGTHVFGRDSRTASLKLGSALSQLASALWMTPKRIVLSP